MSANTPMPAVARQRIPATTETHEAFDRIRRQRCWTFTATAAYAALALAEREGIDLGALLSDMPVRRPQRAPNRRRNAKKLAGGDRRASKREGPARP